MSLLDAIAGPRVPRGELGHRPVRYLLPALCLLAAAVLLLVSSGRPYWRMTLRAPQYPKGLTVVGYIDHLAGDVQEIDELNHYIGMRPLNDAAKIERATGRACLYTFAVLLVVALWVHRPWAALLVFPAAFFPAGFLLDLQYWMWKFGNHLDPHAPLSSSIKPFTPPVLGVGKIGQFRTIAVIDQGMTLAIIAAVLILVGLWFHRAAFRPLVLMRHSQQAQPATAMPATAQTLEH